MALAYSANIQTRIYALLGVKSDTAAQNKVLIDNTWTSGTPGGMAGDALTHIQQIGQYFSLTAPTSVPSEWESWLVARTVLMAGRQMHPDRVASYQEANDAAELAAIDAYDPNLITYDPGASTPVPATLTVQNIRYFVVSHCVRRQRWSTVEGSPRLKPRLWPQFSIIDHNIERVLQNIWGRADWPFKRRSVTLNITPYAISDGTWVASTKTITTATGGLGTIPAGSVCIVTGGTGATLGEYIATTGGSATTVVLTASLSTADLTTGNLALTVIAPTFVGLAGETFDSCASREFFYSDTSGKGESIAWADDGTDMSQLRAWSADGTITARPAKFRFENNATTAGDVFSWYFYPTPDQAYSVKGEVYVKGPSLSSLSLTTTAMGRFPIKFDHVIKTAVLAETLRHYGDPQGKELWQDTEGEIQTLLPQFCDVGVQDNNPVIQDVYDDYRGGAMGGWL